MGLYDSLTIVNSKINTSLNNIYATLSKYMTVPTGQSNRTLSKVSTYIEELMRDKNSKITQLEESVKSKDAEIARLNKSIRDKDSEISRLQNNQFDKSNIEIDSRDGQLKYNGSWLRNCFVQFVNGRFSIGSSEDVRMPVGATGTYYDELLVKFSKQTAGGGGYVGSSGYFVDNRKVYVQIRAEVTEYGCTLSHMVTHDEQWG